jgi:hypothetical protein
VGEISIRYVSSLEQFLGHRKDIENVEPKPIYFERFILRLNKASTNDLGKESCQAFH